MMTHSNKMMKGVVVLSAAAFITKILSAIYKIPFQNLTGNDGFYVYQQVYPIYGIAVVLALNGFPMYVSKLISESDEAEGQIIRQTGFWISLFSAAAFSLLWLFPGQIASLMGDSNLAPVIRSVSYIYLFIPLLSICRGYFQGKLEMMPTGLSQIGEQIFRVSILLIVAFVYSRSGWTVYEMGTWAMRSAWAGMIAASVILLIYINRSDVVSQLKVKAASNVTLKNAGRRFLIEGLALTFMSSMMLLFQLVDAFTVYNGLLSSGYPSSFAMEWKGVYDRGQPFVQLGLVAGVGLSTSLLPLLRSFHLKNQTDQWMKNALFILKTTLILSGSATAGLIAVLPWLNKALFQDQSGTSVLQVYSMSIVILATIHILFSILQSRSSSLKGIDSLFIGLGFKLVFNQFAVRTVGIMGSSVITVLSLLIVMILLFLQVEQDILTNLIKQKVLMRGAVLTAGMGAVVYIIMRLISSLISIETRSAAFLLVLTGVIIGIGVFVIGIVKLNLFTPEEWRKLPLNKIGIPQK